MQMFVVGLTVGAILGLIGGMGVVWVVLFVSALLERNPEETAARSLTAIQTRLQEERERNSAYEGEAYYKPRGEGPAHRADVSRARTGAMAAVQRLP